MSIRFHKISFEGVYAGLEWYGIHPMSIRQAKNRLKEECQIQSVSFGFCPEYKIYWVDPKCTDKKDKIVSWIKSYGTSS